MRGATADAPAFGPDGTLVVKQAHGLTAVTPLNLSLPTARTWRATSRAPQRFSDETIAAGVASGEADALALAAPEHVALRWEQGRLAEVAEVIAATAQQFPAATEFAALDALTRLELGRDDETRELLDGLAQRGSTCRRIRSRCPR